MKKLSVGTKRWLWGVKIMLLVIGSILFLLEFEMLDKDNPSTFEHIVHFIGELGLFIGSAFSNIVTYVFLLVEFILFSFATNSCITGLLCAIPLFGYWYINRLTKQYEKNPQEIS